MKAFKYIGILLTTILIFSSCKQNNNDVTIGYLAESFSAAKWTVDKTYFEEKVKELNANLIVKTSDGNDATQYEQAIELINEGVDVIVIVASNVNSAAAIVREAHKNNVKIIAYDRLILNCEPDYFVGFNAKKTGLIQAQYAISKKPTGNYVLLEGDKADINAIEIEKGQSEGLAEKVKSGDVKILYRVFSDSWSPKEARYEIEKVITLADEKIDVILAANDGTAGGAIEALKKHSIRNDILITGLDADLMACKRIIDGEQTITVYTPLKKLAHTCAELAVKVARKQKLEYSFSTKNNGRKDVLSLILDPVVVDKSNLDIVIKDGLYSKSDIYTQN